MAAHKAEANYSADTYITTLTRCCNHRVIKDRAGKERKRERRFLKECWTRDVLNVMIRMFDVYNVPFLYSTAAHKHTMECAKNPLY